MLFPGDAPGLRFDESIWDTKASQFADFVLRDITLPRWQKAASRYSMKLEKDLEKAEKAYKGELLFSTSSYWPVNEQPSHQPCS